MYSWQTEHVSTEVWRNRYGNARGDGTNSIRQSKV